MSTDIENATVEQRLREIEERLREHEIEIADRRRELVATYVDGADDYDADEHLEFMQEHGIKSPQLSADIAAYRKWKNRAATIDELNATIEKLRPLQTELAIAKTKYEEASEKVNTWDVGTAGLPTVESELEAYQQDAIAQLESRNRLHLAQINHDAIESVKNTLEVQMRNAQQLETDPNSKLAAPLNFVLAD